MSTGRMFKLQITEGTRGLAVTLGSLGAGLTGGVGLVAGLLAVVALGAAAAFGAGADFAAGARIEAPEPSAPDVLLCGRLLDGHLHSVPSSANCARAHKHAHSYLAEQKRQRQEAACKVKATW